MRNKADCRRLKVVATLAPIAKFAAVDPVLLIALAISRRLDDGRLDAGSVAALIARIDAGRPAGVGLATAIRLFVLDRLAAACGRALP